MKQRLKRIGASPEGPKISCEFRIPWRSAAKETSARKGNMIRVRMVVSTGSEPKSFTMAGANAIPSATTATTQIVSTVRLAERKSRVSLSLWACR